MNLFVDLNLSLASSIRPYLSQISLALVATLLVIYGNHINGVVKRAVSSWMLLARIVAFILMCTFGYGLLTIWGQSMVYWLLTHTPSIYRPGAILMAFCVLGILAERKRYL